MRYQYLLFKFLFLALAAGNLFSTCKKEDDNSSTSIAPAQVSAALMVSEWSVAKMMDDGTDKTAQYADYAIKFSADEKLIVKYKQNEVENGNWMVRADDGKTKLYITLPNAKPESVLRRLADDWVLIRRTNTLIELQDDSNTAEQLHLQKL